MLIDEVTISIKAGDGGNGIVHFYRDRMRPKGGPDGGNGGRGGSVIAMGVGDVSKLSQFRFKKKFEAERGVDGSGNQKDGRNGGDLVLEIPKGSTIFYDNGTSVEVSEIGKKYILAAGGKGGLGNHHFRSASNRTPEEYSNGEKREWKHIRIELKLIADIGLIGLPNAGKSSLLNELTNAKAKVANYAFTTLEPNLGVMKSGLIIADIPGIIEGASLGRGLGVKFLKHIEKTKLLVHCISAESINPQSDYETIREEISNYSSTLAHKPEIVVVTKKDIFETEKQQNIFMKITNAQIAVSIIDEESIRQLIGVLEKQSK